MNSIQLAIIACNPNDYSADVLRSALQYIENKENKDLGDAIARTRIGNVLLTREPALETIFNF